jgi:hypothetical protein
LIGFKFWELLYHLVLCALLGYDFRKEEGAMGCTLAVENGVVLGLSKMQWILAIDPHNRCNQGTRLF